MQLGSIFLDKQARYTSGCCNICNFIMYQDSHHLKCNHSSWVGDVVHGEFSSIHIIAGLSWVAAAGSAPVSQQILNVPLDLGSSFGAGDVLQEGADIAVANDVLTVAVDVSVTEGLHHRVDFGHGVDAAAITAPPAVYPQCAAGACGRAEQQDGEEERERFELHDGHDIDPEQIAD